MRESIITHALWAGFHKPEMVEMWWGSGHVDVVEASCFSCSSEGRMEVHSHPH